MSRARPIAWSISDHAAERYVKRIEPRITVQGALIFLRAALPAATRLPEPTIAGQERWLLPDGNCVVVAKPDPKIKAHVAVTVLGPNEMYDVEAIDDVVEAFQRATSPVSAPVAMPPAKVRVVDIKVREAARTSPRDAAVQRDENLRVNYQLLLVAHQRLKAQIERGGMTDVLKMREHVARTEDEARCMKRMLRAAILALREGNCAAGLAALEQERPGITGDHFCYPERFTKEERKAATLAAEQNAGGAQ